MDNNKDINDLQKLAETGWQQMHEILREKGLSKEPVSFSIASKKRNLWMAIAAIVFFMLILSYPYILNSPVSVSLNSGIKPENASSEKIVKQQLSENGSHSEKNHSQVYYQQKKLLQEKLNSQLSQLKKEKEVDLLQRRKIYLLEKFSTENGRNISIPPSDLPIDNNIKFHKSNSVTSPKKSKNVSKKIQIFAGAGANVSIGNNNMHSFNLTDLNIHPGITFICPVSSRLSIHSGLWAFSTIHGKEVITKEKELVNNFASNVYYNINTTSIIKASYFDVPVTLHYSINKNWSVGSGLQLSKLYKVSIKEEKQSFDYNNTLASASVAQYNRTPMAAAAVFQKKVEIKKFEPRFVVEANFEKNHFLFSCGYYYGLDKTITVKDANNSNHEYRNEYFKLGIQYKINKK
ncbi:MAG: outer membrane beta-barrel protein [Ginsengibacter sp.]